MIPLIIIGALVYFWSKKVVAVSPTKASQNLYGVGTPGALSSTPIPNAKPISNVEQTNIANNGNFILPSPNPDTHTPVFYQQNNSATLSEPVTTLSFNPIDFNSQDNSVAPEQKGNTIHNNLVLVKELNKPSLANKTKIPVSQLINDTEFTSDGQDRINTFDLGAPENVGMNTPPIFSTGVGVKYTGQYHAPANLPATQPITSNPNLAHTTAPNPPKQQTITVAVKASANSLSKVATSTPTPSVSKPNIRPFTPIVNRKMLTD
jgi:hypothetical protein